MIVMPPQGKSIIIIIFTVWRCVEIWEKRRKCKNNERVYCDDKLFPRLFTSNKKYIWFLINQKIRRAYGAAKKPLITQRLVQAECFAINFDILTKCRCVFNMRCDDSFTL